MFTPCARGLVPAVLISLVTTGSATCAAAATPFGIEDPYLRGVRIEMKGGRKLIGYVAWSSEPTEYDKNPRFPQSLIDPTANPPDTKTLELYTELYPVSMRFSRRVFPRGDNSRILAATRSGTLTLPIKQIAKIRPLRMRFDGSNAMMDNLITDVRSRTIIRLLISQNPFATLDDNEGSVLVSFNRQIGRRKLAAIGAALMRKLALLEAERTRRLAGEGDADFDKAWAQTKHRLERQRVLMISYRASG